MAFLDPYTGAWTAAEAAHLARRAGFGAPPAEINSMVSAGMSAAVDARVDYPPTDDALDATIAAFIDDPLTDQGRIKNPTSRTQLRGWWIYRMVHANHPLQEQFTLLLHDTLASEYAKVYAGIPTEAEFGNDGLTPGQGCTGGTLPLDEDRKTRLAIRMMRDQNNLYRTAGHLGYRDLLVAITHDPAMLLYLDNFQNIKGRAQENYAREIMELFSMGVGNYSEADVREIARAFTGEGVNRECADGWPMNYQFDAARHDTASKTVFGDSFNFGGAGEDALHVIDLIASRVSGASISPAHSVLPATAIFIAWKFITWFVSEDIPIDHGAVAELADVFYNNQPNGRRLDVRETLRRLFKSQFFYDPAWRFAMFKHPADYIVMALRTLGVEESAYASQSADAMTGMGMSLFSPPNVAGWNHGRAWINSGNLVVRFNYADRISKSGIMTNAYCDSLIPTYIAGTGDNTGIIEYLRARLLQTSLRPGDSAILNQFAADIDDLPNSATTRYYRKIRGLAHLMMTMPQYQLK